MNVKEWARLQGIHPVTAYRWFRAGKLPVPAGRGGGLILVDAPGSAAASGSVAVHARVSSAKKLADLDRQVARSPRGQGALGGSCDHRGGLRLRKNAALYRLAPGRTGRPGRPRTKGNRLPELVKPAVGITWARAEATRDGTTTTVELAHRRCLWHTPFGPRVAQLVMVRELNHTGYAVVLISTDLRATAPEIVERYASRW